MANSSIATPSPMHDRKAPETPPALHAAFSVVRPNTYTMRNESTDPSYERHAHVHNCAGQAVRGGVPFASPALHRTSTIVNNRSGRQHYWACPTNHRVVLCCPLPAIAVHRHCLKWPIHSDPVNILEATAKSKPNSTSFHTATP